MYKKEGQISGKLYEVLFVDKMYTLYLLQDYIVAEVAIEAKEVEKGDSRERFQASLHTDLLTVYR